MKIYKFSERIDIQKAALCLGDFDGIHKGHRSVFDSAKRFGNWGVLLFDRNSKGKPVITTLSEKLELLKGMGADFAAVTEFDESFSHKSPTEFIGFLKAEIGPAALAAGCDYRFGYKAEGDADLLKKLCEKNGMRAIITDLAECDGEPIKSTRIRELISAGNLPCAARLLGMNYFVSGKVLTGFQNGKKLGFPTANTDPAPEKLLPPDGVYAGMVLGRKAVVNIGKNPTFGAKKRTVEAHIIDFCDDLYGKDLKIELIERIRGEIKFDSLGDLKKQIESDVKFAMERKY